MVLSSHRCRTEPQGALPWALLLVCTLLLLPAPHVSSGGLAGKFSNDVYTAPLKNFTARYQLTGEVSGGPCCQRGVGDSFDKRSGIGTLSLYNEYGALNGVVYSRIPPGASESLSAQSLGDWLRAVPLSMLEERGVRPEILREQAGEFGGRTAWVAVVSIPGGSVISRKNWLTGEESRLDSVRGFVVFAREDFVYALMTEINVIGWGGRPGRSYDPDSWDLFMPELEHFYSGMAFGPGAGRTRR